MEPKVISPQAHIDAQLLTRVRQLIPDGSPEAQALDRAIALASAPAVTELTLLPDGADAFEAQGCKYYVSGSLSIERYTLFEEFGLTFGMGQPFGYVFNTLLDVMKMLNSHPVRLGDMSVLVNKSLTHAANLETKEFYGLQVCTLFINREGEDVASWSPELAKAKIADWKAAGLDVRFFLRLAATSVSGFIDAYNLLTGNISPKATSQAQPQELAS